MSSEETRYREVLSEIVRIVGEVTEGNRSAGDEDTCGAAADTTFYGCQIRPLPARLHQKAAEVAVRINPANAPLLELSPGVDEPMRLTLLTSKYWGPRPRSLTVSYMESTPADLRARIIGHLNAWMGTACISFVETSDVGDIRISRGPGGYYSYLGTDTGLIPKNRQTMNLQSFTMNTPESEFRRVIRHEAGHTLGFPHEHMRKALVDRIDPQKAYDYFNRTQGWDRTTVDQQVLTPLNGWSIIGTEPDQDSIMCYQLPGEITYDGQPIRGGADINQTDFTFAGLIYPKQQSGGSVPSDDWDPSEDPPV